MFLLDSIGLHLSLDGAVKGLNQEVNACTGEGRRDRTRAGTVTGEGEAGDWVTATGLVYRLVSTVECVCVVCVCVCVRVCV